MPPREKDDAISIEKLGPQTIVIESPESNEKSWLFEDALKLIGEFSLLKCISNKIKRNALLSALLSVRPCVIYRRNDKSSQGNGLFLL